MKITVSYINSLYDSKKTVDLINETSADAIHVDLIDGIYAGTKNFDINHLPEIFKDNRKPIFTNHIKRPHYRSNPHSCL